MKCVAPKIIVALDQSTEKEVLDFLPRLDPRLCRVKIGSILFTRYGPSLVEKIIQRGFSLFLDLKFHDIPQTVAGACRSAAELGVWMVNVHVLGGVEMMVAAREAIQAFPSTQQPLLIGVTVLTSLNDHDLKIMGLPDNVPATVERYAHLAYQTGLDGIVCSGRETSFLRANLPEDFIFVVPGIRLESDSAGDQKRIMTPHAAFANGANYLVIGRSITQSKDPQDTLLKIAHLK